MIELDEYQRQEFVFLRQFMKRSVLIRLLIMAGLVVSMLIIGKLTSLGAWFDIDNITIAIRDSGFWGFMIFAGLFALGSFLQIPAMIFVLAAILTYGQIEGTFLGFAGVVIAMTANFYFIRMIGGKVLKEVKNKRLQKILAKLDANPLWTIIILRLVLWASPVLNYALAMTDVKPRHYVLGSMIGLILPVIVFSTAVYLFKESVISLITLASFQS